MVNKQVALGPLAVEAGIFAFLLLVVLSSAVAELHGRETAKPPMRTPSATSEENPALPPNSTIPPLPFSLAM